MPTEAVEKIVQTRQQMLKKIEDDQFLLSGGIFVRNEEFYENSEQQSPSKLQVQNKGSAIGIEKGIPRPNTAAGGHVSAQNSARSN